MMIDATPQALSNRPLVVVSGGSRGIGAGICRRLLDRGDRVATFSRQRTTELDTMIDASAGRLYWEPLDIGDRRSLLAFLSRARDRFGRVGHLVNGVGIAHEGLLTLMRAPEVSRMIQVNLEGTISLTQACLKQMLVAGSGAIVNVSSVVAVRGFKGVAAYSATKAALDGFTRSLAKEVSPLGIRVNSVAPGFVDTDLTAGLTPQQRARIVRNTPMGRLGTVADVASAVLFLLSEEAAFITGQTLVVDGGLTV